jgi:putative acetyltransferase
MLPKQNNHISLPMQLLIRAAEPSELAEIQNLFCQTITSVCQKDYDQNQLQAWASAVGDSERWQKLITDQYFLVGELSGKIVGFASLDKGYYIDVLLVHKDFQRMGIAQALFVELEAQAKRLNSPLMTAEVSKTANAFFKGNGFRVLAEQLQVRQNV